MEDKAASDAVCRQVRRSEPGQSRRAQCRRARTGGILQSYSVIPNDAKDAEVVSRGFRFFQEFAADPAKLPGHAPPE
jgi:hypothetical protein